MTARQGSQEYETVDLTLEDLRRGLTPEQRAREIRDIGPERIEAFKRAFVQGYVKMVERQAAQKEQGNVYHE